MPRELRFDAFVDPDIAMSYRDLPDPFTTRVPIGITNSETMTLWFRSTLVSPPAGYSNYTTDLGSIGPGSSVVKIAAFDRARPTVRTTDSLTMRIQAYTDEGYTTLYGQQDLSMSNHLFDHEALTLVDKDNFDDGTKEGWTNYPAEAVDAGVYLTAPYSLPAANSGEPNTAKYRVKIAGVIKQPEEAIPPKLNWFRLCFFMPVNATSEVRIEGVRPNYPCYMVKSFTVPAATRCFILLHMRWRDWVYTGDRMNLDEVWVVTE